MKIKSWLLLILTNLLYSKQYFFMPIGKIDANKAEMLRSVLNEENTYKNCNKNNLDNCISCSYIDNPSSELCYSKKTLLKQTTRNNNFVHLNDKIPNS